jgi:uncharacterized protein
VPTTETSPGGSPAPAGAARAARDPGWTPADTVRTGIALTVAGTLLAVAWWLHGHPERGGTFSFSLLAGASLGVLFERGRFCFYCIFRDLFEKQDSRGVYSVLTALAVGSVGYAFLFTLRLGDPTTGRLPTGAHIAPVSAALVLAGLAFGLGVVVSGGCIAGHLYRLGEGSLRAIPGLVGVLVGFGVGFYTWNPLYFSLISGAPSLWLPAIFGYGGALVLQLSALAAIAVLLLRWNPPQAATPPRVVDLAEVRRRLFFQRWPALLTGALVGVVGVLAYLRVEPLGVTSQLSSATRTALDRHDVLPATLHGLDSTLAGCVALVVETVTTNGWLVIGIVAGSFAAALPGRRVSLERLSLADAGSAFVGGVLLGWGAIIGLGCTVGVWLSGTQALAISGWVFGLAVVAGLAVGFRLRLHRG